MSGVLPDNSADDDVAATAAQVEPVSVSPPAVPPVAETLAVEPQLLEEARNKTTTTATTTTTTTTTASTACDTARAEGGAKKPVVATNAAPTTDATPAPAPAPAPAVTPPASTLPAPAAATGTPPLAYGGDIPPDDARTTIAVCTAGVVLSTLFRTCLEEVGNTEGFVYGHTVTRSTTSVSDASDKGTSSHSTTISIQSFVSTGRPFSFYDAAGVVDEEEVKHALESGPAMPLLGWYVHRANTRVVPSLREASVHRNLARCIAKLRRQPLQPVLLLLLAGRSMQLLPQYNYAAFYYRARPMESLAPVGVDIVNVVHNAVKEYSSFTALSSALHTHSSAATAAAATGASDLSRSGDASTHEAIAALQAPSSHVQALEALVRQTAAQVEATLGKLSTAETSLAAARAQSVLLRVVRAAEEQEGSAGAQLSEATEVGASAGAGAGAGAAAGAEFPRVNVWRP